MLVEDESDRVMPPRRAVMGAGRYDLHHAIQYHGGYRMVLPRLNPQRTMARPSYCPNLATIPKDSAWCCAPLAQIYCCELQS